MTPEYAALVVTRWVAFYTRDLPPAAADRRRAEITADLHEHISSERTRGVADARIALSILSRMARGITADAVWRRRHRHVKGSLMKAVFVVLAAAAVVALGVAAVVYGEADDSPGLQLIGVLLVVGAIGVGFRKVQRSR